MFFASFVARKRGGGAPGTKKTNLEMAPAGGGSKIKNGELTPGAAVPPCPVGVSL